MEPKIRELRPADMDRFCDFCQHREGLDGTTGAARAELVEWIAFHNPDADGNPTYFVAADGDRILGHLGRMPTRFVVEGTLHLASYVHDLFIHPELQHGGRGFFIATRLYRAAEAASHSFCILVWTNEINTGIQKARKYQQLWADRHIKLLRADRQIDRLADRLGDRLADRLGDRLADRLGDRLADRFGDRLADRFGDRLTDRLGDRLADQAGAHHSEPRLLAPLAALGKPLAAGVLEAADRILSMAMDGRRSVTRIDDFDDRFDRFAERMCWRIGISPFKNRAYLRWKYTQRPHLDVATYAALDGNDEILGYVVLCMPSRASGDAYILELMADPEDPRTVLSLATQAVEHCRDAGGTAIYCLATDPRVARVLEQLLFVRRKPQEPLFRANGDRYKNPAVLDRLDNWHFSYGDSEGTI